MTEKILLVDDEKDFLEVMAERLTARGMNVSTADSALEALRLVETETFDAIILDLQMPAMDGIETLKALKQKRPELQIILLTGHATIKKGIEAMKMGAMDFIEKPADVAALTDKIKQAQAQRMVIVEKQVEEKLKKIINVKGW